MNKPIKIIWVLFFLSFIITSCNFQNKTATKAEPKKSIGEALAVLPNATIYETVSYYYKLKNEHLDAYNFNDKNELNTLGYQYINNGKIKEAIEIFKLLVSEFPNSANAYDSLGEAYFKDSNFELAKLNYQKSIALNPKNENADQWIFNIDYKTRERPKFNQIFTKQHYIDDMDEMVKRLVETHLSPFEFISKEAFYDLVNFQKTKITEGMIYGEFIWQMSPIIASIGCEHTQFDQFWIENKMLPIDLRFSIEAELVGTKLLVTNAHHNKKVRLGSSIKSINGVAVTKIIDNIFNHISTNGYTKSLKKAILNRFITSFIPYYLGFPKTYSITLEDHTKAITLTPLKEFEIVSPKKMKALSFDVIEEDNVAKLTIKSFNFYGGKMLEDYKTFIDSSFIAINKKELKI